LIELPQAKVYEVAGKARVLQGGLLLFWLALLQLPPKYVFFTMITTGFSFVRGKNLTIVSNNLDIASHKPSRTLRSAVHDLLSAISRVQTHRRVQTGSRGSAQTAERSWRAGRTSHLVATSLFFFLSFSFFQRGDSPSSGRLKRRLFEEALRKVACWLRCSERLVRTAAAPRR
jgi:hypothetical protein